MLLLGGVPNSLEAQINIFQPGLCENLFMCMIFGGKVWESTAFDFLLPFMIDSSFSKLKMLNKLYIFTGFKG